MPTNKHLLIVFVFVLWISCTLISYPYELAAAEAKDKCRYGYCIGVTSEDVYIRCTRDMRVNMAFGAITGPVGIGLTWASANTLYGRKYDCEKHRQK